jgi:hypothetical protein
MEGIHYLQSKDLVQKALKSWPPAWRWATYYAFAVTILAFGQFSTKDFIYFKF